MAVKDCKTEQLIKETAKRIFLTEGKMFATTQDIADAAGVNRTLLHYYFRSRDILFDMVFKEALAKLRGRLQQVISSNELFKSKVEHFIDVFFDELTESPYLETFIVLQANQYPEKYEELFTQPPEGVEKLKGFLKEIQQEMEKGTIHETKPHHFFMNLFSLLAYPSIAKPLYLKMFQLNEKAFLKLLSERKRVIMTLIFKEGEV